jgi:transcriptional regulator with XRE-family HTH domain
MDIRENLNALIEASGKTKGQIASGSGITPQYLSNLLHNPDIRVSAEVLDRIACELSITVDDILHGDTGSIGVPEQKYVMSCIRCGGQKALSMVPHHLNDETIVGWLFTCQRCAKYVYKGTVAVTYHSDTQEGKV